ncbi:hypothetical protein BDN72DRAFT_866129, partial [Pluteus cervinus]
MRTNSPSTDPVPTDSTREPKPIPTARGSTVDNRATVDVIADLLPHALSLSFSENERAYGAYGASSSSMNEDGHVHLVVTRVWSDADEAKGRYYVVFIGRVPGIYTNWVDASEQVEGYSGNKHQSFPTRRRAEEEWRKWLLQHNQTLQVGTPTPHQENQHGFKLL